MSNYRITKSSIDAIARTYARFYLEHPDINTNSQQNIDFCEVTDICLSQIKQEIPFETEGQMGSANWWRDLYRTINSNPPEELKQYLSWAKIDL